MFVLFVFDPCTLFLFLLSLSQEFADSVHHLPLLLVAVDDFCLELDGSDETPLIPPFLELAHQKRHLFKLFFDNAHLLQDSIRN